MHDKITIGKTVIRFHRKCDNQIGKATVIGYTPETKEYEILKHFLEDEEPMKGAASIFVLGHEIKEIVN